MTTLAALLVSLAQEEKTGEALYRAFAARLESARSLRVEYQVEIQLLNEKFELLSGTVRTLGRDRWTQDLKISPIFAEGRWSRLSLLHDGRRLHVLEGKTEHPLAAGDVRELLQYSFIPQLFYLEGRESRPGTPALSAFRDGGRDGAARVVEYDCAYPHPELRKAVARLFLDPKSLAPLRRELRELEDVGAWTETFTRFEFDPDLPESDFAFQSPRRLALARAAQLGRAAELFTRYTGRHPAALDDLVRRPAALDPELFWPERGFAPWTAIPKDPWGSPYEIRSAAVVSLGADRAPGGTGDAADLRVELAPSPRRPVGAPDAALRRHFQARVDIQLLASAVQAYRDAYGELPRKKADLWERPAAAEVWPEGGWAPAIPPDPWGTPYRVVSEEQRVRVQPAGFHALAAASLSPDQVRELDRAGRHRLSAGERKELERHFDGLSGDEPEVRERAEGALQAWGAGAAIPVRERLKVEKDPEARDRLEALARRFPEPPATWRLELRPLLAVVPRDGREAELSCSNNLSQLWKMQHIYMSVHGSRSKAMPRETGGDFWLKLTKTTPPLIDETHGEVLVCPLSGAAWPECSYAGPAENVNKMADGAFVGMCDDQGHGGAVVLLRKSGDVMEVARDGPEHEEAKKTTRK